MSPNLATPSNLSHSHQVLRRFPWPKDWTIFEKYSSRVRELDVSSQDFCKRATELKILNLFGLLRKSVAPRLRVLNWTARHVLYVNHFVGPSLKTVIVNFTDWGKNEDDQASGLIANLIHFSPALVNLVLAEDFGTRISGALAMLEPTSWSKLRVLCLESYVSPQIVPTLGNLPALETMEIRFIDNEEHHSPNTTSSKSLFPRLTSLQLSAANLTSIPTQFLLGPGNAPRLIELTLYMTDDVPVASSLRECFATLLSRRLGLTRITVLAPPMRLSPQTVQDRATLGTIEPLFALKGLSDLTVSLPFTLDNAALLSIAEVWPSMEVLNLLGQDQPYSRTDVTLGGLAHFVAKCPSLRHLTLNFDASDVGSAWAPSCEDKPCPQLCELDAGASRILDARATAGFINSMFPSAWLVEGGSEGFWERPDAPEGVVYREKWRSVDRLLSNFSVAT